MVDPKRVKPSAPVLVPDKFLARINTIPPTIGEVDTSPPTGPQKVRATFRSAEFEKTIKSHGKILTWRKAMLCACHNETTGQAEVNCFDCDGSGFVYVDPIPLQGLMLNFDRNPKLFERFGMWLDGTCSVTVAPQYRLHHWDSLEMEDSIMSFNELLKKGNRRGRRSRLPANVDSARYRIVNLTKIMLKKTDADGEDSGFLSLEQGYHFEVEENGWIRWRAPGDKAAPDGAIISVLYDFHPTWIVISHPHATRDTLSNRDLNGFGVTPDQVQALPIQAMCRLDYLLADTNSPKAAS